MVSKDLLETQGLDSIEPRYSALQLCRSIKGKRAAARR